MPDDDLLLSEDEELLDAEPVEEPAAPQLVFAPLPVHEMNVPGVRNQSYGRLDQYLVAALPGHSRSSFQEAIEQNLALVNGKPAKASYKVRAGDAIKVTLPITPHLLPQPENIPLDIILEDDYL